MANMKKGNEAGKKFGGKLIPTTKVATPKGGKMVAKGKKSK